MTVIIFKDDYLLISLIYLATESDEFVQEARPLLGPLALHQLHHHPGQRVLHRTSYLHCYSLIYFAP